jgi:hypothetical protein
MGGLGSDDDGATIAGREIDSILNISRASS